MSFDKWIEDKIPNQDAWDRCKNLNKNSGASMTVIKDTAKEVLENNSYPKEEIMDMVEAQVNYSILEHLQ